MTNSHQSFTHTSLNKCALSSFNILLSKRSSKGLTGSSSEDMDARIRIVGSGLRADAGQQIIFPEHNLTIIKGPFTRGICLILGFVRNQTDISSSNHMHVSLIPLSLIVYWISKVFLENQYPPFNLIACRQITKRVFKRPAHYIN